MRNRNREYDRHHRLPRNDKRRKSHLHISLVHKIQHRAYHCLFGDKWGNPFHVARVLNKYFIHSDYYLKVHKLEIKK